MALFSFGIIADVQYADIDNCYNFRKTQLRYYRNAKPTLRRAVKHWMNDERNISFVAQLGDVIDGFNVRGGKRESWRVLMEVMNEFDQFPGQVHHLIGNHELYNFNRDELCESKLFSAKEFKSSQEFDKDDTADYKDDTADYKDDTADYKDDTADYKDDTADYKEKFYYHFSPCTGFRFVQIDSYDIAMLGWGEESAIMHQARQIVTSVNCNEDLNSPLGLDGFDNRFVKFNGAVGDRQRKWLKRVLKNAENDDEKVFIFGHIPFHPNKSSNNICLLWDYEQVLKILHQFKCVVATFSGHTHTTAYTLDANKIHHVVIPSVVETPPGTDAFGTIDVYDDRIVLNGHGSVTSAEFKYCPSV